MATLVPAPRHVALAAGLLGDDRLADVARFLPAGYVAQVARELDPSRLARLAGAMPPATTRACLAALDAPVLLRTAAAIDDDALLGALVAGLPDARLAEVLRAAQAHGLWPQALDVARRLPPAQRRRLAELAAEQDNALLRDLARAARERGRLGEVLALLPAVARRRLG